MTPPLDLESFIRRSNEAETPEALYQLLETALADLAGYDRVLFSLMSDHASLGLDAGHGIMRNYPDDWMKHYVAQGYEHVDPVRRFGFRHMGPFLWDSLPLVTSLHPRQITCMNECTDAGFHHGAALCIRGVDGELGGIGVAASSRDKRFSDADARYRLSVVNIIATHFYNAFCALHRSEETTMPAAPVLLTERELDVLRLMARALKDEAIAHALEISTHAVDFHARNILRKLATRNRLSAVMRAIASGILPLEATTLRRPAT